MRELSTGELVEINGGIHFNLGAAAATLAIGLVTGGPAGLGIAVGALLVAKGVNNLDNMYQNEFGKNK